MKRMNLSKWTMALLCVCFVFFTSCDKDNFDTKQKKEVNKQENKNNKEKEEKQKQEENKKKEEEEKRKQEEEEKQKQEENKKKEEEEKRKQEEEMKKNQLTLNPTSLTVSPLETKNVNIENGEAPYEVTLLGNKIAVTTINNEGNFFTVTGLIEGETEFLVTDKNKKTAKITVTVKVKK